MHLELTDEQTKALIRELSLIIEYDPHGLGRLVDVHIMARWKWATAPATASRRWNVSGRRAMAEAQPQCRTDGRSWARRRGVRSGTLGRLAKAATIGPSPCSTRLT